MQILLLLCAFLVFCLIYGLCTSAKAVANGADRIRSHLDPKARSGGAAPQGHGGHRSCVQDVQALFALYQAGALTREEFDEAKRHLLARLKAAA